MKIIPIRPRTKRAPESDARYDNAVLIAAIIASFVFIYAVVARAADRMWIDPPTVSATPSQPFEASIRLDTDRQVGAAAVSFYDYDAHAVEFGGATLGDSVPQTWYFAVYDDIPEYPGLVYIITIGSGLDYIIGAGLEVARLHFTAGPCGADSIPVSSDPALTYLSTLQLETIYAPPLVVHGADISVDCTVDVAPPITWGRVKALYQ